MPYAAFSVGASAHGLVRLPLRAFVQSGGRESFPHRVQIAVLETPLWLDVELILGRRVVLEHLQFWQMGGRGQGPGEFVIRWGFREPASV